jgi:hypothetical protein
MKRIVDVTFSVEVEVDETKFTDQWLADWRKAFYQFGSIEDHIEHIAQLAARDLLNPPFTEGYGPLSDMGISAKVVEQTQDLRP